jgi:CBS domain-containing protein
LYITPVGEIVHRQPVTTAQGISIKEAAARMARDRISSLIVVDDGGMPVGMLTDRDLREKVVAQGKDVTLPINSIMSSSLITIDALESCFEALLKMIRHKIHHILVMEDDRLKGMVTNHDFMTLQGASPTALVKDIEKAQSLDELCEVTARISRTVAVLLDNGAKAHNITGFITELTEKTLNRVVDFIEEQLGRPPCPSTLFLFGEAGRREMSLDFNLALGLIVKDAETDTAIPGDDRYFQALAEKLNRTLDLCFGVDRQYLGQANIRRFSDWQSFLLAEVTEANAGPRAKFLEMRCVRGRETEVIRLREKLSGIAAGNPHFIKLLAVASMSNCPPLGFFKHFVVEKTGEHTDKLNLYEKGIKPFIDITRLHALEHGSLSLATRDRLADLEKLHFEQAKSVASALDYLQTFLLRKQLAQIETGQQADNFVQPEALDAFEKKTMKESFHLITTLFEQLEKKFSTVR